jgi:DNA ligase 1
MRAFADLLDRLVYTPSRLGKLRLLVAYFRATPDPDRGYALAALADGLVTRLPVRRSIGLLLEQRRIDPELFRLSRDYVGDTAETVALLWPEPFGPCPPLRLAAVAEELAALDPGGLPDRLGRWLDCLDVAGRWALLKLLTGGLRVGVSARLAKTAVAMSGNREVDDIEEIWHGLASPYTELFLWLEGVGPKPDPSGAPVFRPLMLSHPLEDVEWAALDLSQFAVEWKWDGVRVQISSAPAAARLYSRTGDDIGRSFPDLVAGFNFEAVLDGELLVVREGIVGPFKDLQQRLNRRTVSRPMLRDYPAHIRLYDALSIDGEDLRALPLLERRRHLEDWFEKTRPPRTDLSPFLEVVDKPTLEAIWAQTRGDGIEGLMLKRRDGPYLAGRPKGHWYKWKRAPLTLDCVLMYAQRGSGKRSSFYSDYTFGLWREAADGTAELVPVGKAYSGYTDAELLVLDRWVRNHTLETFGPVRRVEPGVVLEVAFDAAHKSPRHKSGVAMRFPRIARIRWDKPADEADRLDTMLRLTGVNTEPVKA